MRILVLLLFAAAAHAQPFADMDKKIRAGEFKKITSVVVSKGGAIVHEAYYDDGGAEALRDTRSVTKTVTSILAGIAGLDVDTRVLPLFRDKQPFANPDKRKDKITAGELMTMTSILECDDWNEYSRGNEERMYLIEDWAKFALDLPVGAKGNAFSYCTAGVFVLGRVIERTTKMRIEELARTRLFEPLGIDKVEWQIVPTGEAMTGGGLDLRSRDLLKLGQLYLQRGMWNGRQIVPAKWVEQSTTPHARIDETNEYGYLWWLRRFRKDDPRTAAWYMTGNGGNRVIVFPQLDAVVVITSANFNQRDMHQLSDKLVTDFILSGIQ
jgi:CubicO group peptidase (beta-lactamase class C family)